jgi:hypothetical protein
MRISRIRGCKKSFPSFLCHEVGATHLHPCLTFSALLYSSLTSSANWQISEHGPNTVWMVWIRPTRQNRPFQTLQTLRWCHGSGSAYSNFLTTYNLLYNSHCPASCAHVSHDSTASLMTTCHKLWQGVTTCDGHMTLNMDSFVSSAFVPFTLTSALYFCALYSLLGPLVCSTKGAPCIHD